MLQLANETPFSASLSVFPDEQGVESAYAVVKATFMFGADGPQLAAKQFPLLAADVFVGDPTQTSLKATGDFTLPKPATDVLLIGRAIAPAPDTREADVTLRVGPVSRTLRIFGDRHWEKSGDAWRPSTPQPWERMRLRWELAYGGIAPRDVNGVQEYEPFNPIGQGFLARGASPVEGQRLPNLEDPQALLSTPEDRPRPACFAPIAATWMPRKGYAGTYDAAWIGKRAPYLPLDFDPRFFHLAPPELIAPGFLKGGEEVTLTGFSRGGSLKFLLPQCSLSIEFEFDGAKLPKPPQLEMVLFEPDAGPFQMLWRAGLAVDKKVLKLSKLTVRCFEYSKGAPLARLNAMPGAYAHND